MLGIIRKTMESKRDYCAIICTSGSRNSWTPCAALHILTKKKKHTKDGV